MLEFLLWVFLFMFFTTGFFAMVYLFVFVVGSAITMTGEVIVALYTFYRGR